MSRQQRAALFINPASRKGADIAGEIRQHLADRAVIVDVDSASAAATTRSVAALRDDVDVVIAAGGDGTLHYVARALVGSPTPLAVIPLGTANDFARSVGLPLELAPAIETALGGEVSAVDVGCINGEVSYLNEAGVGVIEDVTNEISSRRKQVLGSLEYVYAAARACLRADPVHLRLTIDGELESRIALQLLVGVGRYFGPAIEIAPGASPDDGLLHLCIVEASSSFDLVAAAFHLMRGNHEHADQLEVRQATCVTIETPAPRPIYADGEVVAETPARIEVIPSGLRVRVPQRVSPAATMR